MDLITKEELKDKLDRGDRFKLVMALGDWAFRAKHIPGSINLNAPDQVSNALPDKEEEIVVYCSSKTCAASGYAYQTLTENGYTKVRRYSGGIDEWEAAGYPLEGEWVQHGR